MTTDTTPVATCAVCGGLIIADEPFVGCDERGNLADPVDTGFYRHSACGLQAQEQGNG